MFCLYCGAPLNASEQICPVCGQAVNAAEKQATLNCANCGASIEKGDAFCVECGAPVTIVTEPESPCCPHCGATIEEEDAFCVECGNPVQLPSKSAGSTEPICSDCVDDIRPTETANGKIPVEETAFESLAPKVKEATEENPPMGSASEIPPTQSLENVEEIHLEENHSEAGYASKAAPVAESAKKRIPVPAIAAIAAAAVLIIALLFVPKLLNGESQGSPASQSSGTGELNLTASVDADNQAFLDALATIADANGDGKLSNEEIADITDLSLDSADIASLEGIASLSNLQTLDIRKCPNVTEADLSNLASLSEVYARGSGLKHITISGDNNLTVLTLDDSTTVVGLEDTGLQAQWQLTSYEQNGYGGCDAQHEGSWQAQYDYDSANRLATQRVTEKKDGTTVTRVREFTYDADGTLDSIVETDETGAVTANIEYAYDNSTASIEKRSQSGELVKGYYATIDNEGRVTHVELDNPGFSVDYSYDEFGRLTSARYHEADAEYINRFEYDSAGRIVKEDDGISGAARDISYKYDSDGVCIERIITAADGSPVYSKSFYSYDENGNIQAEDAKFEYDEQGNLIERELRGNAGETGSTTASYRRVFVSNGEEVFQPLVTGDPEAEPMMVLPCTINLSDSDQDPIARRYGPFVLRDI